jgi:hypothetical protein
MTATTTTTNTVSETLPASGCATEAGIPFNISGNGTDAPG